MGAGAGYPARSPCDERQRVAPLGPQAATPSIRLSSGAAGGEFRMPRQVQGEAVQFLRAAPRCDSAPVKRASIAAGVPGVRRSSRTQYARVILVGAGGEPHALGKRSRLYFANHSKSPPSRYARVPGIVAQHRDTRYTPRARPAPAISSATAATIARARSDPARHGIAGREDQAHCRPALPFPAARPAQTGAMAAHMSGRVNPSHSAPPPPMESPVR